VILDVMLPGFDGFELCRRLRGGGCWVPVLILTARTELAERVRGLDCGADDYLAKPFSFDELFARLRALIRRGAAERPAVAALALGGGAGTATAFAAGHGPARAHQASSEPTGPDTDNLQVGDQISPDPSAAGAANAASSARTGASHAKGEDNGGDGEHGNDGPGGHADPSGNVDHQFNGVE